MSYDNRPIPAQLGRVHPADPASEELVPTPDAFQDSADAAESDAPAEPAKPNRGSRAAREIFETLLLAVVIFVAVRMVVLNFRVDGTSMAPNLHNREMVLVNRNAYFSFDSNWLFGLLPGVDREGENIVYPFDPPQRGDIIVFDPPVAAFSKPYIKRVIGLPGETVSVQDGIVYINGVQLDEPYIDGNITGCRNTLNCPPVTVEEGHVFVLGDNRQNSQDSRSFGSVATDEIIGKAWITYWPIGDFGFVPHQDYPDLDTPD